MADSEQQDMAGKTVIVIGASRGIGAGFVEAYLEQGATVIATCRDLKQSETLIALSKVYGKERLRIYDKIDVTDAAQRQAFAEKIKDEEIDFLILNAGIKGYPRSKMTPIEHSAEQLMEAFEVNTNAHDDFTRLLSPKLKKANSAVVYISTGVASTQDNGGGNYHPYRISKVMGNKLCANWRNYYEKVFGSETRPMVIALAPGWVKTDMGGQDARLTVAESVQAMIRRINEIVDEKNDHCLRLHNGKDLERYTEYRSPKESSRNLGRNIFSPDKPLKKASLLNDTNNTDKTVVIVNTSYQVADYDFKLIEQYLAKDFKVITHYEGKKEDNQVLLRLVKTYSEQFSVHENLNLQNTEDLCTFSSSIKNLDYLIFNTLKASQLLIEDKTETNPVSCTPEMLKNAFKTNVIIPDTIIRELFGKIIHADSAAVVYLTSQLSTIEAYRSGLGEHADMSSKTAANMMILNWFHEFLAYYEKSKDMTTNDNANLPVAFAICSEENPIKQQVINNIMDSIETIRQTKAATSVFSCNGEVIDTYEQVLKERLKRFQETVCSESKKSLCM